MEPRAKPAGDERIPDSREAGERRRARAAAAENGGEGGRAAGAAAGAALSPEQAAEIEALRRESQPTRRPTVAALEELLYTPIPVLDRGFVRVVDYLGDDGAVVQAARVSYGKGTRKASDDRGLIRYLMRHRHTTPFEMCEIKLHVKLPIFVARQWIRHRTANVNEYSARYSVLDDEFYLPAPEHLAAQSKTDRQGREETLGEEEAARVLDLLRGDAERAYRDYREMLNEDDEGRVIDPSRKGLSRELARMNLTLNVYTQWYWKIDLHNLLHFLSLRADAHAQYEIRAYAEALCGIVEKWVPLTFEAFRDYRMTGLHVSGPALSVLRELLDEAKLKDEGALAELAKKQGLSPREFRELLRALKKDG